MVEGIAAPSAEPIVFLAPTEVQPEALEELPHFQRLRELLHSRC